MGSIPSIHVQSLRAPIFARSQPTKFDPRANSKYCNEHMIKKWFELVDREKNGSFTYDKFRASRLGSMHTEEKAREIFSTMDVDGSETVEWEEFRMYHERSGLPPLEEL
mmetsp:Transcript_83188/g.222959  ORF Transcript_83188/g.222959 Transcript_83188/m.222959 type:complete len:109 (-) Transcript_83188:317-643(-)|eukprot:CAMPEP_0113692270 /NCGR_PEP_ID=MMETSP0038_2-20120614/18982_1 /TAXON_ID=2898 /ORGANISM="Cryptomonas paramecium" /LENGTH=108 /DNA_ID=CAMNT_0000614145 /DNA_START=58 /DNA_END=384 /DNA_ORIENTATION=- /assembly_acc=CAM_ASM_000170